VLRRGDLPKKIDRPDFDRSQAIFSREEAEALLSDARIPEDRRVFYALGLLTGMRPGEVASLLWRDYDAGAEPLGRLYVGKAFEPYSETVKGTKTDSPRNVPVHPTLAAVLARWKLSGWRRIFSRDPKPGDLIIPALDGKHRGDPTLRELHADLALMGAPPRRVY